MQFLCVCVAALSAISATTFISYVEYGGAGCIKSPANHSDSGLIASLANEDAQKLPVRGIKSLEIVQRRKKLS